MYLHSTHITYIIGKDHGCLSLCMLLAGLAWDWISQKLYWTDYCDDDIEVYDPSTGARRVLFDLDHDAPYAIVVDPINGYVDK